jgi:hypothetical protein
MNKSESISKLALDLLKSQAEMGDAVKGAKNPFFKSSFADLNSVREACIPVLNRNNISVLQPTTFLEGKSFVETTLLHSSGEWLSSMTEIVYAKTNDPQGQGSGISYARRYGLQALLNIGAVDDDGETAMGRTASKTYHAPPSGLTATSVAPQALVSTTPLPLGAVQMAQSLNTEAPRVSNFKKKPKQTTETPVTESSSEEW